MGRQKFTINGERLKSLRDEKCKTQLTIARELHAKLGIKTKPSDKLLLTSYQRNERTGNITRQRANALAEILGVPLKVLQGEKPAEENQQELEIPDTWEYQRQIERTIREALERGGNTLLEHALQHELDHTFMTGTPAENRNDAIRYLAQDIATRIEAVQLIRNENEIAELSRLTGLSEKELLRPANVEGIWFINIQYRYGQQHSEGSNYHSEVTQRASWARNIIEEHLKKLMEEFSCSDDSICLTQNGFWYRIEIRTTRVRMTIRIDLVRCLPDAKGLRWVKPSWRDEFLIRDPLGYWAKENFNFVTDFNGKQLPSGDIRNLRLLLTEYNLNDRWSPRPTGRMVISGNLGEMNDEMLTSFQNEGQAHLAVLNWLTNDLKYTLARLLADYPRECWSVRDLSIDLDENRSKDRKRPLSERYLGKKYSIELVEQVGEDKFQSVPWREKDRKALEESIIKMLDAPNDPAWTTDEPRRTFPPTAANHSSATCIAR